jgi:hypothetical protein
MPIVERSYYGNVRRTAYDLWLGPNYIQDTNDDDTLFGGLCVLRLAIRKGTTMKPEIEARAVYATLRPDYPQDVILRAMYWDSKTVVRSTPPGTPFKIAARFVRIPLKLLLQWIASLENIPTTIQTKANEDDSLPICTLKVETNSVTNLLEKTWQVVEGENAEINRVWQAVWQQMGQALQTYPIITALEESFPSKYIQLQAEPYDLQAYQPTLNLP